ncbi:hypothetical protein Taro_011605 [Colocasia esculenta]|uniref:Aminotransferase-like plant mobile domain-containing protein n=1 Tax=Colocasia esculenta TaxID=4460 RepID=A0A843U6Q1_COLES|nr:hypothetical protein [Colocasia esculenta]
MEGGKEIGEGSSRRKRQAERRSSRRRVEEPPVEGEVPEVRMEEEEEEKVAPVVNVEEERKRQAKAMKSTEPLEGECREKCPRKVGSNKEGSGRFGLENASVRPAATWCRGGAGRRDIVATSRTNATLSRPKKGEMRARVSWTLVLAAFLAFPLFQQERIEEMGFGEIFRIERMRVDPALTQALRSRWDTEASAFAFPWGHMIPSLEDVSWITGLRVYGRAVSGYTYPCYHDLAERLLDLLVERRSSLVPRVALQESLGLYEAGKNVGESEDEYLARLARVSQRELESEPGSQVDLDLRRFLILFLGRLLFATRGDPVHCRFLLLLEDLGEVGGYAWGAAFLAHQFDGLSASERQTSTSGFYPFLQVWAYLHLPALGRGDLTWPGLVPIARRWDSRRDTRHLVDQLERLQEAIDSYPYLDVVWQPYLGEGDEGQPWLAPARPYFGRSVWLHALNLVLPLNLFLTQRSLGLRQSVVEFPVRDRFRRPGRRFRGLHDTTDWRERARESDATTDDAYLQAYALKYGGKIYKSARHQVDVNGEIASLRALLHSAVQDRKAAQRQTAELRSELERVRGTGADGASSSRSAGGSPLLLEARLTGAVLRAEEAQRHLEELERDLELAHEHAMELQSERDRFRGEVQTTRSERDQLCIRAEAAEAQVVEMARELATLRVQRPPGDQEEVTRLRAEPLAHQTLTRGLQQIVMDIGRSRSRSRSGASVSRATGASVGQYLAGSSSKRRNEEEERHRQGEGSAHDGRGGGEMLPPPDRREGSGESGGGQ